MEEQVSVARRPIFKFRLPLASARPEIGENEISRHQKFKVLVSATQT